MSSTIESRPTGKFFDEFDIGETWETAGRTITETDLVLFASWSGDNHPLHTNEEYAKTTQFGTRIFHGPGAFALATGLEVRLGFKDGTAIAFLGMTWNLKAPVMIGDTIRVTETVAAKRESKKPDRGVITFDVAILNQRDEVCQDGQWLVLFKRDTT
jgi:acyl dehydratase